MTEADCLNAGPGRRCTATLNGQRARFAFVPRYARTSGENRRKGEQRAARKRRSMRH
jgi:hypothetical protein